MALAAALVLAGISVVLLSIYGADVVAIHGGGDGFLPFDHMIRGLGLGGTSIVLPIVAFFISRNEPSRPLGAMILIAGVMIIIGGAVLLAGSPGCRRDGVWHGRAARGQAGSAGRDGSDPGSGHYSS